MKKFTRWRRCDKCGASRKKISAVLMQKGDDNLEHGQSGTLDREVIARRCEECGYIWNELPRDA